MKLDEVQVPIFTSLAGVEPGKSYVAMGPAGICWAGKVVARFNDGPEAWMLILQPNGRDGQPAVIRAGDIRPGTAIVRFNVSCADTDPVLALSERECAQAAQIFMDRWAIGDDRDPRLFRSEEEIFFQFRRCGKDDRMWHMHTFGSHQVAVMMLDSSEPIYMQADGRVVVELLKGAGKTCFTAHP